MQLKIIGHQASFKVGDLSNNAKKIIQLYKESQCNLVVFPELCLTGYNCQDLFLDKQFLLKVNYYISEIAKCVDDKALIIGAPQLINNKVFNSAILLQNGKVLHIYHKRCLPQYNIFDEVRYFEPGPQLSSIFELNGFKIRILICEDLWHPDIELYSADTLCEAAIIINASPYAINKTQQRIKYLKDFSTKYNHKYILYINAVGSEDHLLFDGGSIILADNKLFELNKWIESTITIPYIAFANDSTDIVFRKAQSDIFDLDDNIAAEIYNGIILGLRNYSAYTSCNQFVIGLSGGIDSALVAVMAVDAFGPENVLCVAMPSEYSSQHSIDDAKALANSLKCQFEIIPINNIKLTFDSILEPLLGKLSDNELTNENLQPRIRATIIMAIANKDNRLLLCTSNKSESAVGYSTLYGDMTGAYAPIIDLYKTQVYSICKWRNKLSNVISDNILTKEPSAELKPNQKDSDFLPNYILLDRILYSLIELGIDPKEFDILLIKHIKNLLYKSEFKRFQAPPGPKINSIMLGTDRRYPICLKFN